MLSGDNKLPDFTLDFNIPKKEEDEPIGFEPSKKSKKQKQEEELKKKQAEKQAEIDS